MGGADVNKASNGVAPLDVSSFIAHRYAVEALVRVPAAADTFLEPSMPPSTSTLTSWTLFKTHVLLKRHMTVQHCDM
jgi:hypothetical protein